VPYVCHPRRLLERIGEAALGNAPDERHLPALESRTDLTALPSGLAFPAAASRLPDARPGAASFANARPVRAARGVQVMEREPRHRRFWLRARRARFAFRFRFGGWHLLLSFAPRRGLGVGVWRHLNKVPHLLQHAA